MLTEREALKCIGEAKKADKAKWNSLNKWVKRGGFEKHDADGNEVLDAGELQGALNEFFMDEQYWTNIKK